MSFELMIIAAVLIGLAVSVAALIHPAGPALLVLLITPFDPILTNIFGVAGNFITIVPILLVLFKAGPSGWGGAFLGSSVQRALILFLMSVSLSFVIGFDANGISSLVVYAQRFAGFLLVGVIAHGFRNDEHLDLGLKVLTVSMALFALVSMLEFYLGIRLLPTGGVDSLGVAGAERTANVHATRLVGAGQSVPINRLALQLLLPIGIAMGWLMHSLRRGRGLIQIGCLVVLLSALFGTMSRSGIAGLAVGGAVVMVVAFKLRPTMVLGTLILGSVLAFGASQVLSYVDVDEEFASRLTTSDLEGGQGVRTSAWAHGLRLFADSPVIGVGYGVVVTDDVKWSAESRDPHNAYIRVLSYYGLLGMSFFLFLVWTTFRSLLGSRVIGAERIEYWRPYFLAGLFSLLTVNFFNSYFFDRFMFIVMGFAAALEMSRIEVLIASRQSAAQRASGHADGGPIPEPVGGSGWGGPAVAPGAPAAPPSPFLEREP